MNYLTVSCHFLRHALWAWLSLPVFVLGKWWDMLTTRFWYTRNSLIFCYQLHILSLERKIYLTWSQCKKKFCHVERLALSTDDSQESPKVLTITILAEKREADQIQTAQNNFGEERNPSWGQELNYIGTALWSANDLTLNFCLWSIMKPGSKPSQDILLVSTELYRCATVKIMFRAQ